LFLGQEAFREKPVTLKSPMNACDIHICTLNIYHHSRIFLPGPIWALRDNFLELTLMNSIHIICLQDTKLRKEHHRQAREAFAQYNYDIFFTKGDSPFGCAIAFSTDLQTRNRTRLSCTACIDTLLEGTRRMRIITSYWSPHEDASSHRAAKRDSLQEVDNSLRLEYPTLMLGDVNRRSCPRSFREALARGLKDVPPPGPTVITPEGSSMADAILTSDDLRPAIHSAATYPQDLSLSDIHIPFTAKIKTAAIRIPSQAFSIRRTMLPTAKIPAIIARAESNATTNTKPAPQLVRDLLSDISTAQARKATVPPNSTPWKRSHTRRMHTDIKLIVRVHLFIMRTRKLDIKEQQQRRPELLAIVRNSPHELLHLASKPLDEAHAWCAQRIRRLKKTYLAQCKCDAESHIQRSTDRITHMAMKAIPALKKLVRRSHTSCSPLTAIVKDNILVTEAALIERILWDCWVDRVFNQHERTDEMPGPTEGYEEFVHGQHAQAPAIRKMLDQPFDEGELLAAAHAMNKKAVTVDAPAGLLLKLGPKMLRAFCTVFNEAYLRGVNTTLPIHLLLCMLPKSENLTDPTKRRLIGLASVFRKWLFVCASRRQTHIAAKFNIIHPTAFGFMQEIDVFDVIYPLNALRDWAWLTDSPLFILWIDQFKAYDSIHWGNSFTHMRYWGMDKLAHFYWTAFSSTMWAFLTGHGRTNTFTPANGGSQGCPSVCILYVMSVTPLLNRLDHLSFKLWNIPLSSFSYVDDIHTVHTALDTFRLQIQCVERFVSVNKNKIDPGGGEVQGPNKRPRH